MVARYSPSHSIQIAQISVGDRVLLRWNGYKGVAGWLHGGWATVVNIGRSRIAVDADGEANGPEWPQRWIRTDQIAEHEPQRATA